MKKPHRKTAEVAWWQFVDDLAVSLYSDQITDRVALFGGYFAMTYKQLLLRKYCTPGGSIVDCALRTKRANIIELLAE